MRQRTHENVATVLVNPVVLRDLELELMAQDLRVWAVRTAPTFPDPERLAFQIRRSLVEASQGRWDDASDWTVIWIAFGDSWRDGEEPLPWAAHATLWDTLSRYGDQVRYHLGLGGVPPLPVRQEDR